MAGKSEKRAWFSGYDWHLISILESKMKPNKNQWIFYVIAGGAVIVNEIASRSELQALTFLPLALIVAWAAFRFLPTEKPEG